MSAYRCTKEGCNFSTNDVEAFVQHALDERLLKELPTAEPPKTVKHTTVQDYLNCPVCYAKFEKLLLARGWKKTTEKQRTESKGLRL